MYYTFDDTIHDNLKFDIQQAMYTLQNLTCVRFYPRLNNERDYVHYRSFKDDDCSSHIGRIGGMQNIRIGPGCTQQRIILHEICHALGFWHEQSRPDRDAYLGVLWDNVRRGLKSQFLKRNTLEVDYQGEAYDYASVMHYRNTSFNRESGLFTLNITNETEYNRQGKPDIGRVPTLSKSDVTQLNRLYNCPGSGIPGKLTINIQTANNLSATDDAYVIVTAYDDNGNNMSFKTDNITNQDYPVWNKKFRFGRRTNWQYVTVSTWDYDHNSDDDIIISPQSFSINPGNHSFKQCRSYKCHKNMAFSMNLDEICHCLNNGKCVKSPRRARKPPARKATRGCKCPSNFGGPNCQYPRGVLKITADHAKNLPISTDAYVKVLAYDHNGAIINNQTRFIHNNENPVWNEELDFGVNVWSWFTIQAWDEDFGSRDDRLSYAYTYALNESISHRRHTIKAFEGGSVMFSHTFC